MPIKYALFPNHLTDDPNDYMAVVQGQETYTMDDIIDIMMRRGSTVNRADTVSVFEERREAIREILENGNSVETDLVRISPSIPGVFIDPADRFDSSRHYVALNTNRGSMISEIARNLTVEKVDAVKPRPVPHVFRDVMSNTSNKTLTPGGIGELIGNRMKVDPDDERQGIFLIAADKSEIRVETIARNKPSNLIFSIPAGLTSGEYEMEIRATAKDSDNVREGKLDAILVVP